LGFEGRNFVAGAPTIADIESFDPDVTALEPIRVYVGLDSADSVEERVDLAIAELERTGAFERAVLVAVTPTGTGWVDPDAARTIEHMYGGDTAIVSVQYSFLPSWIAFLLDTTSPKVLGTALFDGIHEAWAALPEDDRPVLLAFGQSLGSMGGETAFAEPSLSGSIDAITSRYDGALFTGPTRDNAVYGTLVDERDPGSPSWKPTVARNRTSEWRTGSPTSTPRTHPGSSRVCCGSTTRRTPSAPGGSPTCGVLPGGPTIRLRTTFRPLPPGYRLSRSYRNPST
jgi:uncharacterized membrane protein